MHRVSCMLQYGSYFGHPHVAFGAVDDRYSRERTSSQGAGRSQGNRALASCFANLQGCRAGNMQETQPTPALSPPAPGRSTLCQSTPCQSTPCRAALGPPLGFHTRVLPGRGVPAPFGASSQQGQQHSGHPSPKPPPLAPWVFGLCLAGGLGEVPAARVRLWSRARRALNAQPNAPGLLKSRLSRPLGASIFWVTSI